MDSIKDAMPATKEQALDLLTPWFRDRRPVSYGLGYPPVTLMAFGFISTLTDSEIEITSNGEQDSGNHSLRLKLTDATYTYTDFRDMPEEQRSVVDCGVVIAVPIGSFNVTADETWSIPLVLKICIGSFTAEGEKNLTGDLPAEQ